ncbi:glycosyltransferase family 4 protein [Limnobacter sp.]|uniref:glycosyltransferase family 4 protein n=1 Tax=Limnobacter sp. TaxID=2003368 RepID=UPI002FDF355C
MTNRKIAYIVNHVAFFVSHRLPLAIGAKSAGFDVALFTGQPGSDLMEGEAVKKLAEEYIPHKRAIFRSSGLNPLIELLGLLQIVIFLLKFRPDIVHCASPKGVLYGGIAARICRVPGLVLAVSGMGYAYTKGSEKRWTRICIRQIYGFLAKLAFSHQNLKVIVQNKDDYLSLINSKLVKKSSLTLIPGSGVDLSLFNNCLPDKKKHIVLLPARMLKDKGVSEFVSAARKIRIIEPEWRFVLAGAADYKNPSSISQTDLRNWQIEGIVEWIGHVDNMVPWFRDAALVCLPSYREGMPKSLLEAAAACCAIVTTDVVGCREAIEPAVTGDLVPAHDIDALTETLLLLIQDKSRRQTYGKNGRERALRLYSIHSVVNQTTQIYKGLF